MQSTADNYKKQKNIKDGNYSMIYTRHLEKRLRDLETERQLIYVERMKLEQKVKNLRNELDQLNSLPLITGIIIDILDDNSDRVIVKCSRGPEYVLSCSYKVRKKRLTPGMRVALNERYLAIMELLPSELDPFIKGMELIDSIPDITYNDIGGLEDQIREIREIVELPLKKPELFKRIGIEPPKGVLLYGAPGTGKTLLAKAVAHETEATFIRIIGSELVQKFIGEGAKYVREIFDLARKKAPTILFIDELDAMGAERMEDSRSGDREVQRTLMQLLSELDGFDKRGNVIFIGATNRIDILDPALLRPGRFDRIIELPIPNEKSRESIFKIHTRNLKLEDKFNIKKLVSATNKATGAEIKAICTEAGMFAIRREAETITNEDFNKAIYKIMKKIEVNPSKSNLFI